MASPKSQTIYTIPLASLLEAKLNPTQWVFCYMLHAQQGVEATAYLENMGGFPESDLRDLGRRNFVTYINPGLRKPEVEQMNNLKVTKAFEDILYGTSSTGETVSDDSLMIDDDTAFNELFEAYPPYIEVSGGRAPGRSLSFELGAERYSLATKGLRSKHVEILTLLEWGRAHNLVNMGLQKFIESRQWLSIQQAKESGDYGGSYDNQESI